MLKNDAELDATKEASDIFWIRFRNCVKVETNPPNYRFSGGGYLAEIDRMNLEVREYFSLHPSELED